MFRLWPRRNVVRPIITPNILPDRPDKEDAVPNGGRSHSEDGGGVLNSPRVRSAWLAVATFCIGAALDVSGLTSPRASAWLAGVASFLLVFWALSDSAVFDRLPRLFKPGAVIALASLVVGGSVIFLVAILTWPSIEEEQLNNENANKHNIGTILPADDPLPNVDCGEVNGDGAYLFLGDHTFYHSSFPISVMVFHGDEIISLDRSGEELLLSVNLYGPKGLLARIHDNELRVTQSGIFDYDRPDAHTLIVYDLWGDEVLHVRYMRRNAIRIEGIFRSKYAKSPVVISDRYIMRGENRVATISGFCFVDAGVDMLVQ